MSTREQPESIQLQQRQDTKPSRSFNGQRIVDRSRTASDAAFSSAVASRQPGRSELRSVTIKPAAVPIT